MRHGRWQIGYGALRRPCVAGAVAALAAIVVCGAVPREAAAFWPVTRTYRPAAADSLTRARHERMWVEFQKPPGETSPAAQDSAAQAAAGGGPATYISRVNSNERIETPAAGAPGTSGSPGSGTPAPVPAPTPAAADSAVAGPFGDLIARARAQQAAADSAAVANGEAAADGDTTDAMGLPPPPGTLPSLTGSGPTGTPPTAAAAAALAAAMAANAGWTPVLTSKYLLNSDNQDAAVDLRSMFTDPTGVTIGNTLGYHNVLSLLRKQESDTRMMVNTLSIPLRTRGFTFGMSTNNTKSKSASQAATGNALTTTSNNKAAQANLSVSRRLSTIPVLSRASIALAGFGINASGGVEYSASRSDQQTSAGIGSSTNKHESKGRSFGAGLAYDRLRWMNFRIRTGRLLRNNDDSIEQVKQLNAAPERIDSETNSAGDTTTVDISIPTVWKLQALTVGYRISNGEDTRPENATGSSGTAQGVGFQFETTKNYSRSLSLTAKAQPLARLDMSLTMGAGRDSTGYKIKRLSFTDTQKMSWKLENHLRLWGTGMLTANYESSIADVDRDAFNPLTSSLELSPQTRRDESRKLYTEYAKDLTATWKTKWSYEIQIDQGFYEHPGASGGLSDVDQLRTRLALDFSGQMTANATATVTMYYRTLDKAYIDPSQSSLSKNEEEYVVRPMYTWVVTPKVTVSQRFSLESKVLDDVFKPERSTLDRNHTMNTAMRYDMTSRLHLDAAYDYGLLDNGSYPSVPGQDTRYFTPIQRTKKDQISLNTRCDLLHGDKLAFVSQQVSTRTRRLSPPSGGFVGAPISESSALTLGLESKLEIGGAKLDCRLRWTDNNFFGGRKRYADGNATFEWSF